jgi:hypothetical protein
VPRLPSSDPAADAAILMERRDFLRAAALAPAVALTGRGVPAEAAAAEPADRDLWLQHLARLTDPVLTNLARGTLRAQMPIEQAAGADRKGVTYLEAFGRLMAGLAPWLELSGLDGEEARLQARTRTLATNALEVAVDPASPDAMNFTRESQPLVDAAFLAQAILRAPTALGDAMSSATKRRLVAALASTRTITPGFNNWLLFSATVEAALKALGASWDHVRVDYALRQHEQWYKGDGVYGDGPQFHWDYYNSFVIQPMLLDVLETCGGDSPAWGEMRPRILERSRRYAVILERLIAPDGSFPAIGRSLAYRCGAFHLLAALALRRQLPDALAPAQVRAALTAVIQRTLGAADTFDANGWLTIGLAGHQPTLGEGYISTGSLYLSAVAFLPLGLAPPDPFWASAPVPWTSVRTWRGEAVPIDHAL